LHVTRRQLIGQIGSSVVLPVLIGGCNDGSGHGPAASAPAPVPPQVPTPTSTSTPSPQPSSKPTRHPDAVVVALAGSSSAEQYLTTYSGPPDDSRITVSSDGFNFSPLRQGAFGKVSGSAIIAATGKAVRFVRGGVGGSTLAEWAVPKSRQRIELVSRINAAGGADALLLQVGRNDVTDKIVGSVTDQVNLIRTLIEQVRSETSIPHLQVFLGGSQDVLEGDDVQRQLLGIQREAELTVANTDEGVRYGFSTYDLPVVDGLHQSETGQMMSGQRFGAQMSAWLIGAVERRGPFICCCRSVGATTTQVQLTHRNGTDFTPASGISGFQIKVGERALAIFAARRVSYNLVEITHETAALTERFVSYALFTDTDDILCAKDNSPELLPLEPSLGSIVSLER
jgi:hypothetical protein